MTSEIEFVKNISFAIQVAFFALYWLAIIAEWRCVKKTRGKKS